MVNDYGVSFVNTFTLSFTYLFFCTPLPQGALGVFIGSLPVFLFFRLFIGSGQWAGMILSRFPAQPLREFGWQAELADPAEAKYISVERASKKAFMGLSYMALSER